MTAYETFVSKAPWMMDNLIKHFQFSVEDAAAIAGNAGHESNGFATLQEIKPTVAGSLGGFGWFQWTGPRRRAYETWCKGQGLTTISDEANYGFLRHELNTTEAKAVAATKKAIGLKAKTIAFELAFERAGVKHYESRLKWANIALEAYNSRKPPVVVLDAIPKPTIPKPPVLTIQSVMTALAALVAAAVTYLLSRG